MNVVSKILGKENTHAKCLFVDSIGQGYESDSSGIFTKVSPPENQKFLTSGGDTLAYITNKRILSTKYGGIDIDSLNFRINGNYPSSYQLDSSIGNIFIVNGVTCATVFVVTDQVKKYEVPMYALYASVIGNELLLAGMKHRAVNADGDCTKRSKAITAKLNLHKEICIFDSFGLRLQGLAANSINSEFSSLRVRLESWLGGAPFKRGHVLIGGIADLYIDDDLSYFGLEPEGNEFVGVSLFYLEDDEIQPLHYLAGKEYLSFTSIDDSLAIYLSSREDGCNTKISNLSIVIIESLTNALLEKATRFTGISESAEISRFNVAKIGDGRYVGLIEEITGSINRKVWQINSNDLINWTALPIGELSLI